MMEISSIADAQRHIRNIRRVLLILTLIIAFYSYIAFAGKVSDRIYFDIQSDHYCSRRLNATHQMGCTSKLGGNSGVIWYVEHEVDIEHILNNGPTPPYIAVLNRKFFTRDYLLAFRAKPDRVAGVIFLDRAQEHETKTPFDSPFSPEDRCPNRYSGLYVNDTQYGDCKQNLWQVESQVSGLLYDDIPYPIFLVNQQNSILAISSCFNDHNRVAGIGEKKQATYPLCSMQMDSFMTAAGDAETCLNSHSFVDDLLQTSGRRCLNVDNQNIFAYYKTATGPLHPVDKLNRAKPDVAEAQSVVLLVAKLSSLSMFTDLSPGADSTVTPIVTMLAVADALGRVKSDEEVQKSKRNIAFAFLDSEPFDYTGSSAMVYSMTKNNFPNSLFVWTGANETIAIQNINLTSIDYVINLDQLASYPGADAIHLHYDPLSRDDEKLGNAVKIMQNVASEEKVNLQEAGQNVPMPPGPVHEFIRQSQSLLKEKRPMGLLLSNYEKTYTNMFYHSIFDDKQNVNQIKKDELTNHLSRVASLVARSVYELTFKARSDKVTVDKQLVDQLLQCYLVDASCNLFTRAWQAGQKLPPHPIQTFKDPIKQSDDMNGAITSSLLAYFVGDKLPDFNFTRCARENAESFIYSYEYVNGKDSPVTDLVSGLCVRSQVQKISAQSPAFKVNQETNYIEVNPKYPAWTMSLNTIRNPVRLFLRPSPIYQWCVFATGILVTLMAFLVVRHISASISTLKSEGNSSLVTST